MEEKIENTFLIILWLIFDTENFYIIQNWNYKNYYSSIGWFSINRFEYSIILSWIFLVFFFQIRSLPKLKLRPLTKKFSIIPSISLQNICINCVKKHRWRIQRDESYNFDKLFDGCSKKKKKIKIKISLKTIPIFQPSRFVI